MPLGRHLLVELTGCAPERLNDVTGIEQICVRSARNAGATVVSSSFHPFSPHGVSGVVVIHESHVAVHTWPEHGYVALDVFTCGDTIDPAAIADSIESALGATGSSRNQIDRGETFDSVSTGATEHYSGASDRSIWFTDREADIALSLRASGALFRQRSQYQKVEILETVGYGRMLVLDDRIVCTEHDEFIYHEMLVHVPAFAGHSPTRALVLGGGDGGAARELLRHASISRIDVVEIDETVVQAARSHLQSLSASLNDDRVHLHIGDGAHFLGKAAPGTYDLVLVDSGVPSGPSDALFSPAFYAAVRTALKPNGRFVTQLPPPSLSADGFRQTCQTVTGSLGQAQPYLAYIPTYNTGMLAFALCSPGQPDALSRIRLEDAEAFSRAHALRYFNAETARATYALPAYIRSLVTTDA